MGLLDKAKEKATHLAEQAKEKIDDVKEKRKVDELLDDLGLILYRQRTDRGQPGDEAVIVGLVEELGARGRHERRAGVGRPGERERPRRGVRGLST
jgi:hypothetical protein